MYGYLDHYSKQKVDLAL